MMECEWSFLLQSPHFVTQESISLVGGCSALYSQLGASQVWNSIYTSRNLPETMHTPYLTSLSARMSHYVQDFAWASLPKHTRSPPLVSISSSILDHRSHLIFSIVHLGEPFHACTLCFLGRRISFSGVVVLFCRRSSLVAHHADAFSHSHRRSRPTTTAFNT